MTLMVGSSGGVKAMLTKVVMPQGGQDLEAGKVVQWHKKEGDPVNKGEVICEVETEKAVFEVEAPAGGYLRKIVVQQGQEAKILSVIGLIGALEDDVEAEAGGPPVQATTPPAVAAAPAAPESRLGGRGASERMPISPKAKKVAQELGVSIDQVQGTGPRGRITEKDVLAHHERQAGRSAAPAGAPSAIPAPLPIPLPAGGGRLVSMSKVRKVTARRMQQSKQVVPHFYATVAVDMTEAMNFREKFNEVLNNDAQDRVSLTHMITRACALALRELPEVNSSFKDEETIAQWEDVNIGVAVALDAGLVVPVLQNADRLNLRQIAQETRRIAALAQEGKQASLAPARFTISNLGMFNVDNFIAIINPPEAAILAVSSVERRVVVVEGDRMALRDMMNMTLSIDHRVGDGVLACKFVNKVRSLLEDPGSLL
jgi:pyruvate dehydrogenase E2 component (dihydrolipoamide acetyltransferase)